MQPKAAQAAQLSIPLIDLHFTDFAILALLLAILYGLSAIEVLLSSQNGGLSELDRIDLQKASTWALLGILATLIAGISTDISSGAQTFEIATVLVPIFFVGRWAYFHLRSSRLVQIDLIRNELDNIYRGEIVGYISGLASPASIDEIYVQCAKQLHSSHITARLTSSLGVKVFTVSLGLNEFVGDLLFTREKCERLLNGLVETRLLKREANSYQYQRSLPEARSTT
jgi:hypothetical protein